MEVLDFDRKGTKDTITRRQLSTAYRLSPGSKHVTEQNEWDDDALKRSAI